MRALTLILLAATAAALLPGGAVAQTIQPGLANGFEIDGNLYSNNPGAVTGLGNDWLDGPAGPGAGVLNPDGTPRNPATTVHFLDGIRNADLDVFGSSNKVFHDPNTYSWKGGSVPQKDDIENGLVDFTTDGLGNRWISVAGDRRSVKGDSYLDYEFLQTPLYQNSDGTFSSAGPHGGRTVGDILLTIRLDQGGADADFYAQRWESDGAGGYNYVDIPIPSGAAFVAANIDSIAHTTFDAFGSEQYAVNQFGEAAVNLSALLPTFDECFGIATIFIRTKSSTSFDAELKDFLEPIQVNICLDDEKPVLTCPPDLSVSCDQSFDPGTAGFATATDNCTDEPAVTYSDSTAAGLCAGSSTIYRTWSATDDCGNTVECTQVITVTDTTPPAISSAPGDVTVECADDVPAPDVTAVVASDECGEVTVTHVGDVSDNGSCPELITRTYRATDDCGNSTDYTQTITVDDTTPPQADGPDDVTVECRDDIPAPDTGVVTATDNCGGVRVVHAGDSSDGKSCPETITRTYRVTDACGNGTDVTQKIVVDDHTAPVLSGPADATVACRDEIPEPDVSLVTASDNCGEVAVVHAGDTSDGNACPEVVTRAYSATDSCGNTTTVYQKFTVNDTIPPRADGPDDVTIACIDELAAADVDLITASDNCGDVEVRHVGDVSDGKSCPETITRTYRVTDDCGNTTDVVQKITVLDDTDPTAAPLSSVTVECADDVPAPDPSVVDASDDCGAVSVVHVRDDSDGESCPETITRTYRVSDDCGNWIDCTQKIVIDDTTNPTVTSGPGNLTVECIADIPGPDPLTVLATDNCGDPTVAFVGDLSDGASCPETITRTYRVTDRCGNSTDYVQTIVVDDTTPPVIGDLPDRTLECPESWAFDAPTASDNCDTSPLVTMLCEGTTFGPEPWTMHIKRIWVASDACNNVSASTSQTLTLHCEPASMSTFTQGFYGNAGGFFNGRGTLEIIRSLLGEPLVVGKPGRSLSISRPAAECVIARLPAGSTPATLPDIGDANLNKNTCQSNPPLPVDSEGKFVNVLLGQTITLSLNTRLNWPLLLFPLEQEFCTQRVLPGRDRLYGTDDDVVDPAAPVETWHIPVAVLNALDAGYLPRNVWGLLELANFALADMDTWGATLAQVNNAVDTINNAFNECRAVVDCNGDDGGDGKFTRELSTASGDAFAPPAPTSFALEQNVPNPFNPRTSIRVALPEASDWTLTIYNVAGQVVQRYQGSTTAAAFVDVEWDGFDERGRQMASGVYFYRVTAGRFAAVRKMVLLK